MPIWRVKRWPRPDKWPGPGPREGKHLGKTLRPQSWKVSQGMRLLLVSLGLKQLSPGATMGNMLTSLGVPPCI